MNKTPRARSSLFARLPRSRLAALCFLVSCLGTAAGAYEWQDGAGFRFADLPVPKSGHIGFTLLSPAGTGILFTNRLSEQRHLTNQILLNGSGVAAGDVDGDGWCDLYFCGLDGPNGLYRNLGNWKFEDVTESAGVACPNLDATGAAFADLDGDGDLDLIVNSVGGGTHVFFNDGKGHFTEAKNFTVLNPQKCGTSLALADIDGDGYLDLYVANYRVSALMDMPNTQFKLKVVNGRQIVESVNGRPTTEPDLAGRFTVNSRGGIDEHGEVDALYRNQGGTNFIPVSFTGGAFLDEDGRPLTAPPQDWGLSAMFRDINGDGLPDLYVCNDFDSIERIWINQGGGRFKAVARLAIRQSSFFSMGIDFADINRDGFDDFVVLDMLSRDHQQRMLAAPVSNPPLPVIGVIDNRPQYSRNTLFLNRGDGTYAEIAGLSGLEASEWSWCPAFLDVDLDGWEDLLVTNGNERDSRNLDITERLKARRTTTQMSNTEILQARKLFPRLATPNLAFRNQHDLTFVEVGAQWGFNAPGVSQGMALADLDNDGDLDVVVNNLEGPAGIYRNDVVAPRVAVRLKGRPPNTRGIGAKIKVFGGPVAMQSQEMICGGRYLSSDDPMRVFAAGSLTNELRIEVVWPSGAHSVVSNAKPNRIYEINEAGAMVRTNSESESARLETTRQGAPFFQDVSPLLRHVHQEEPFDDYARQPLLPNRLSQLGPGVTWCDLDGDGWEDLVIGSGKGGAMAVYRNTGTGGFKRWVEPPFIGAVARDQTTPLGWKKSSTQTVLIVGAANYEDGLHEGGCVRLYEPGRKLPEDLLPGRESSSGPLAMADVDGDGTPDLFVGGRCLPGKYPVAASSALFRNAAGKFDIDADNTSRLANIGLVSGAVFSDIDGDGDPDLILACEWGPVRIFRNDHGRLTEATSELGLADFKGWWNGVAVGDFDGDGRMDIVASNWGRNTKYESRRSKPLRIYFGDFNGDGAIGIIEAAYTPEMKKWVPLRGLDVVSKSLPFLRARFATHQAYGEAGIEEMLGDRLNAAGWVEANWLESTVFLNRGNRFEARVLPVEAQMAPGFGLCVGDFDGDGHEDIFLSQNFFASQPETPRGDAGRGLWLRGDGQGGFTAVPGQQSGIRVYGEQRGAALCDYDRDGRVDLVVTQNGTETKLFKNQGARIGLGVKLLGTPENPAAIGAQLRLDFGTALGPAREIHAGSGYWSADSVAQVLATPEPPKKIRVRWPGGKETTSDLPAAAKEISVDFSGKVEVLR